MLLYNSRQKHAACAKQGFLGGAGGRNQGVMEMGSLRRWERRLPEEKIWLHCAIFHNRKGTQRQEGEGGRNWERIVQEPGSSTLPKQR